MKLPRFDHCRVLTIGDVMLDRYWHGSATRISPEAPIPVVDVQHIESRLGGAANVALNIAALGGQASLSGVIGQDESARIIEAKLESAGIRNLLQVKDDYRTITKYRIISQKQQLIRADFETLVPFTPDNFIKSLMEYADEFDSLILSDYDKGVLAQPGALIEAALSIGKPVLVDPKFKNFKEYQGATIIKPNQVEFARSVGSWQSESEMVAKCSRMIDDLGCEAMLITRGSDGMTLVQPRGLVHHLPAHSREVFDVSGAGDTVIAVLGAALAAGETFLDAVNLANLAAGIVVGRMGTASVSGPELRLAVANEFGSSKGIMSTEQLIAAVNEARQNGERVVFTNGCFDILHAGHVDYLAEAREQGDRLIVAVNDDQSVKRLKGEGRPINSLDRRQTVLAGLSSVDWVCSFSEDTPVELLKLIKPDVLVKGGDYTIDGVVGADIVKSYHGSVKVLQLLDGLSTTALAEKIKKL